MFYFKEMVYELISSEVQSIRAERVGLSLDETIELEFKDSAIIFWFMADVSDQGMICFDRWMLLAFCGGLRTSHDFDIEQLNSIIN